MFNEALKTGHLDRNFMRFQWNGMESILRSWEVNGRREMEGNQAYRSFNKSALYETEALRLAWGEGA